MSKKYFEYGNKELEYLKAQDIKLAKIIEDKGFINREVDDNIFASLISSIIGQQISGKAANAIRTRFKKIVGDMTPDEVNNLSTEEIKSVGISLRKVEYIKGIAKSIVNGDVELDNLKNLSDEEVIETLTKFKGVGVWTAEMLMIFSLQRKNILSFLDLGIRRGIMKVHNHEQLTESNFQYYKNLYSPYGSIAAFYFWEM